MLTNNILSNTVSEFAIDSNGYNISKFGRGYEFDWMFVYIDSIGGKLGVSDRTT